MNWCNWSTVVYVYLLISGFLIENTRRSFRTGTIFAFIASNSSRGVPKLFQLEPKVYLTMLPNFA